MNIFLRSLRLNSDLLRIDAFKAIACRLNQCQTNSLDTKLHKRNFNGISRISYGQNNQLKNINTTNYRQIRSKYNRNKGGGKNEEKSDDEDEDLSKYSETGQKDKNVVQFKTQSTRADLIIKSALGVSRNKIEKFFYESRLRVNGKKLPKKSCTIREGDEIEIVKDFCPNNPVNIVVSRIEILSISVRGEDIVIVARRHKTYTIENYSGENAYKSSAAV